MLAGLHKEDVNAAIRKRFGSVAAFERVRGLTEKSVHDVLRGRPNARTRDAIEKVLNDNTGIESPTEVSVCSGAGASAHRLNAGAR